MADPLANLDGHIKVSLQHYLSTPVADRCKEQYDGLVTQLTRAAMEYSRAMIQSRLDSRRQAQQQIGKRR